MATVSENAAFWGQYDWSRHGEEWSSGWGGSQAQWYGLVLPRIAKFLPVGSMLEIAPGHGRCTHFLREHGETLAIVDLSEDCIRACRERFAGDDRITYHVNDGRSLGMLEEGSIDFAFTFDSLVHVDADVVEAYLSELARVLAPDGVAFVHHSNAARYRRYFQATGRIRSPRVRQALYELHLLDRPRWRSLDMTADRFRTTCEAAGLGCITQEIIPWSTRRSIDCFSTITRPGSRWSRPNRVLVNDRFLDETAAIELRAPLYSP